MEGGKLQRGGRHGEAALAAPTGLAACSHRRAMNRASIALVKSLGFRREGYSPRYLKIGGRWRDHERWALLVDDWRPQRHRSSRKAIS